MSAPVIEGYELLGALGTGGSGRVYEARDPRGATVAVKVLREGADETSAARLVREAELVREMRHRALIRVHGAGRTADGRPYLVMERVEGRTLSARVAEDGPLSPGDAWRLVREVASALEHAHARGVLHRDLTPANVLLDEDDRPKLGDFGLARRASDPALSRDGATVGTPLYMAPEQWWGARVDERTDVYGLGAILYEALTGAAPWADEEPSELVHRVATAAPRPPRDRDAELPADVERFVVRCLSRDAGERPASVAAFVREGDAAFGRTPRRPLDPWIALGLPLLLPFAMGYAGTRDPRTWILESGYAAYAVLVGWALAAVMVWRWPKARGLGPLLPAVQGALGFVTGMMMVERAVAGAAAEVRYALFNVGFAEASASWFLGGAASASLFAFVAVRGLPRARPELRTVIAAAAMLATGALAADVPTLCVCGLGAALTLRGTTERADAGLAGLAAVLSLAVAALARQLSEAARVFDADMTRTARALALTELDERQTALAFGILLTLAAMIAATRWRGVRAWATRRVALVGVAAALVAISLIAPFAWSLSRRAELGADLERHLAVWSELDPPAGEGRAEGRLGPTLQIGRRHVSIDSERVMLTRALDDDAGGAAGLVLAQAIGARVSADRDGPELVLAADRSLPPRVVRHALSAAYDVGVRRIDLLLIAGEPLRLPPGAPPEARLVLPSDVRALPLSLRADHPEREATRFGELAAQLAREGADDLAVGD